MQGLAYYRCISNLNKICEEQMKIPKIKKDTEVSLKNM